ncbi:MAG TPA: Rid family hydrolase [Propylenella sp.]|nr:Rid family hydrolase [Propylenella sp.]
MLRPLNPHSLRAPFARYSHGVEIASAARLVFCSGQLGIAADGTVPATVEGQAERCFENIRAVLHEAGLGFGHVLRINAYVTRREDMAGYMAVRDRFVGDPPPASTLMIVSGFTRPEFLVEVEAVAAAE